MTFDLSSFVPAPEEHFFLPNSVVENLERIAALSQRHPVNVLVAGKQGCGKSTLVKQFAARNRRPLATFQIGILSEPGQLFGEHRLKDGETYYQQFLFPQAIQTPGCVIHLEEINRPEHPKALNMLFSVLAEDRKVWLDELGLIRVADGVVFMATLNEGEEFVGTELLDAALRDRFYVTALDYLPADVETKVLHYKTGIPEAEALTIVNVANKLRGNSKDPMVVSTRHTLMIAEMVAVGASIEDAFIYSLQAGKDLLESILLSLHVQLGKKDAHTETGYQIY
ncbi:AAA family ATPase [Desulfoglaeba alkanexedens]|uniref:CbbQ/NirQ/NorQ/GpvN family protein n=1 Tax=Desulfoglaeba alkanexedens ALDC TaxID=980445 RepID=A0A4P8L7A2_9BACT|nr:AAA family ATPase [Desulfoglaeba alkanexedens]QCQ23055.1 CbbQ/NirQ/NorQ/GpvN family protein [Desulfoglaeba alkanexedens ALDC]